MEPDKPEIEEEEEMVRKTVLSGHFSHLVNCAFSECSACFLLAPYLICFDDNERTSILYLQLTIHPLKTRKNQRSLLYAIATNLCSGEETFHIFLTYMYF